MVKRSILRFLEPSNASRLKGSPANIPQPKGPGFSAQRRRFQPTFDHLSDALEQADPTLVLREDPNGIAPERALVFVTVGRIQRFVKVASQLGFEVLAETTLALTEEIPDGFRPADGTNVLQRNLYATVPTIDALQRLLSLWRAYESGSAAPKRAGTWWTLFALLLELRTWGPDDRLDESTRKTIEDRLPFDDEAEVPIELEIWPSSDDQQRVAWRHEAERRIADIGGRVLDHAAISENGFIYEGILAGLSARAVRQMLDEPWDLKGLATVEGVQFVLPQTIAETWPSERSGGPTLDTPRTRFDSNAPIRAALLDGTPQPRHSMLDGGLTVEDVHDLVGLSVVDQRRHATGMASLILRGDLNADGEALRDTRLASVPVLVDIGGDTRSPQDRLFVDLVHVALTRLLKGEEPLTGDVFVVNFSVGLRECHFGGRISALARLMDWWSSSEGILFVISAGNTGELMLEEVKPSEFEDANTEKRRYIVDDALRAAAFGRTILAPAECLNGLCIGAISRDISGDDPPEQAGILSLEDCNSVFPQITSALGLGPHRSIKPDLLAPGGKLEFRAFPHREGTLLRPVTVYGRTGLAAAAPGGQFGTIQKVCGTSGATALTTRAILQSAEALTGEGGPYEGQELPRRALALLTRALAVNSAKWPQEAWQLRDAEKQRLGRYFDVRAKEEVCRRFGHGILDAELMRNSQESGVTMVGCGEIRKDGAQIFSFPFPSTLSGERVPRSMRATVAWFSPVDTVRSQYRLVGFEIAAAGEFEEIEDSRWGFNLKTSGPDKNMVKRGTVWSRRLIHSTQKVPAREGNRALQLRVQCRDTSGGGLSPDESISYALAVTLEIEAEIQHDIYQEIRDQLLLTVKTDA
ncbi:MAG: S8 family serine peptidase [Bryobacterales bacterium]|nr:S8 family serine peptidase [Bryobacterales bacterium]